MTPQARPRYGFAALCALALSLSPAPAAPAAKDDIEQRRAAQRTAFTDAEILEGFFRVTLGAEWADSRSIDRLRKFDGPVRVHVNNRGRPDRRVALSAILKDIAARIEHIDIAETPTRAEANLIVTLTRDRDLDRTIRSVYGEKRGRAILRDLNPQCLSGFRKDDRFVIQHAEAILVVDAGDFIFTDCAYEEILQSLGPINDDPGLPWTLFNDEVQFGFFTVFDQYVLNLLYHPRVRPGMTRAEIEALAPEILPGIRAFVAKTNGL